MLFGQPAPDVASCRAIPSVNKKSNMKPDLLASEWDVCLENQTKDPLFRPD